MLFVSVSFEYGIAALAAMSALVIVESAIFTPVTALVAIVGFG